MTLSNHFVSIELNAGKGAKMAGVITKKHWKLVAKELGWKVAIKLLLSRKPIALTTLISF